MPHYLSCANCPHSLLAIFRGEWYTCSHVPFSGIVFGAPDQGTSSVRVYAIDLSRTSGALVKIVALHSTPRASRPGWLFCFPGSVQERRMV